VLDYAV